MDKLFHIKNSDENNEDFGHIIHNKSQRTFYPTTINEISQILSYCRHEQIPISCRGQSHSTYGQSQSLNGIVMNISEYNKIIDIGHDSITVEAGIKWSDVVNVTLKQQLTPPVLTDYLELSVGGVLSMGGLGGQTHRYGTVADNILAIKVITVNGEIHHCSREENTELFYDSFSTLGQFTIILEATIKLITSPTICKCYNLLYDNLQNYLEDSTYLLKNKLSSYLEGQFIWQENQWTYMIELVIYDVDIDVSSLHHISYSIEEKSYYDFIYRMNTQIPFLHSNGTWSNYHPWINLLLPHEEIYPNMLKIISQLTIKNTGGWPVLLYPLDTSLFYNTYFMTPSTDVIWIFAILRQTNNVEDAKILVEQNSEMLIKNAKVYPVGSVNINWKEHYGDKWKEFHIKKKQYDPLLLLGRGYNIKY